MSETITPPAQGSVQTQAAQPAAKPKRPKPKSMLMIGEQTNALFENARLAKERGRWGGRPLFFPRRSRKPWD